MGRRKKYLTEEERKAAKKESMKKWLRANKEHWNDYYKEYNKANKERIKKHRKTYKETPMGRAVYLVSRYKQSDKEMGRGECTLTAKWVVDNIFPKPCIYCGVEGWDIMGCDRIDNDKPHTQENVVPCCEECNKKRHRKSFEVFLKEMRNYETAINYNN